MFGNRRRVAFGAGNFTGEQPVAAPANALVECVGAGFAALPEVIQRAHHGTVRLFGAAQVERGRGIGGLIALIVRLPRSNPKAEFSVTGWHFPDQMIWSRMFDGRKFESVFALEDGDLVERIGPLSLVLKPVAESGRIQYRLAGMNLGPIALPRTLCPSLVAWEGEREGKYEFEVDIGLPLFGRIVRYSGLLDLEVLSE